MGTVGITPVSDPTGAGALLDLLKLLSDPAAAEAKLQEIKDAQARLQATSDALVVQQAEVKEQIAHINLYEEQAAKQLREARELMEDFEARQARLKRAETENIETAARMAEREAALDLAERTFGEEITTKEADIAVRLEALAASEADARAEKQRYLDELQALREVTA